MVPRPKDDQRDPPHRFQLTVNDRNWHVERRPATAGRGVPIPPDVWRCRVDDEEANLPAKGRETFGTLRERLTAALREQQGAAGKRPRGGAGTGQ
jgi:hypothetical protein